MESTLFTELTLSEQATLSGGRRGGNGNGNGHGRRPNRNRGGDGGTNTLDIYFEINVDQSADGGDA